MKQVTVAVTAWVVYVEGIDPGETPSIDDYNGPGWYFVDDKGDHIGPYITDETAALSKALIERMTSIILNMPDSEGP